MADGMTTGEIEDVLSSIRRLVSDGNRPIFRAAPRPYAHEAEKLILTPALRIQTLDEETQPPLRLTLTESVATEPPPSRPPLGDVISAIAAAVPRQVAGWEPETGDPTDPIVPAPEAGGWTDEPATRWPAVPDGAGTAPKAPDTVWEDEDDEGWDALTADPADPFQPLGAEIPARSPSADAQAAEALPALDAAALTEIIREVLREELRGPLGERITGNLRKLVRTEIARALAVREQD